jgi:hypothetical protein
LKASTKQKRERDRQTDTDPTPINALGGKKKAQQATRLQRKRKLDQDEDAVDEYEPKEERSE